MISFFTKNRGFFLYFCAVAIFFLLLNYFVPFKFYGTDPYYFWGSAKYFLAGKLDFEDIFWNLYPSGFTLILAGFVKLFTFLDFRSLLMTFLILSFICGPVFLKIAYKKLHLSFYELLFFFFFSISGFYVIEYLIGEILLPQAWAFLLIPLYPYAFFHKNRYGKLLTLFLIYLLHSPTALLLTIVSSFFIFFKKYREKSIEIAIFMLPLLALKLMQILMLKVGFVYQDLPLNKFLEIFYLKTSVQNFQPIFYRFSLMEFAYSGVPFFFWILLLNRKNFFKSPERIFYTLFFLLISLIIVFYKEWTLIFPIGWPRERYLGYLWISLGLCSICIVKDLNQKRRRVFYAIASIFIVMQSFMAIYRETRMNTQIENLISSIYELKVDSEANEKVLFLSDSNANSYAYGIMAEKDILFSVSEPANINVRTWESIIFEQFKDKNLMLNFLLKNNIRVIVYSKEFAEYFSFLKDDAYYTLIDTNNQSL